MEGRISTEDIVRAANSKIKTISAEDKDAQLRLREVCEKLAMYTREAGLKEGFVFTLNLGSYDFIIEPQVGIQETPWLVESRYLLSAKITFRTYVWNGYEQKKMTATIPQMAKFLGRYDLWDQFCSQAMNFLQGKSRPEKQALLN